MSLPMQGELLFDPDFHATKIKCLQLDGPDMLAKACYLPLCWETYLHHRRSQLVHTCLASRERSISHIMYSGLDIVAMKRHKHTHTHTHTQCWLR